jgi:hypothetical protein
MRNLFVWLPPKTKQARARSTNPEDVDRHGGARIGCRVVKGLVSTARALCESPMMARATRIGIGLRIIFLCASLKNCKISTRRLESAIVLGSDDQSALQLLAHALLDVLEIRRVHHAVTVLVKVAFTSRSPLVSPRIRKKKRFVSNVPLPSRSRPRV